MNKTIEGAGSDRNFNPLQYAEKPGESSFVLQDSPVGDQYRLLRFATVRGPGSSADGWIGFDRTATIPTRSSADMICFTMYSDLAAENRAPPLYPNATRSILAPYPVVAAQCRRQSPTEAHASIHYVQDHRSQAVLASALTLAQQVNGSSEVYRLEYDEIQFFSPVWMPSPEAGSTSLIGVFFAWQLSSNKTAAPSLDWVLTEGLVTDLKQKSRLIVTTCTISAYWTSGEVQWMISQSTGIHGQVQTGPLSTIERYNVTPITLDPTSVDVGHGTELPRVMYGQEEAFLSGAFALAIAEHPRHLYVDVQAPLGRDASNSTAFTFITRFHGYGYSTTSVFITLSSVTISLYCVVTVLYMSYILITGSTSTAWSSAIELVALALQSNKPDHLGEISVGIDSLETFNQGVGIRVNKENRLELVFNQDQNTRYLGKIIKNKVY